jgi:hypothetical protein
MTNINDIIDVIRIGDSKNIHVRFANKGINDFTGQAKIGLFEGHYYALIERDINLTTQCSRVLANATGGLGGDINVTVTIKDHQIPGFIKGSTGIIRLDDKNHFVLICLEGLPT